MLSRKKKRFIAGLGVAFAIGGFLCVAHMFDLLSGWQLQSGDFLFQTGNLHQEAESAGEIVVVGIDEKSLKELGQLQSWPRSYYAQLIDVLAESEARVIAFDVLFAEATPDDEQLAASIKNAGNVILPVVYSYSDHSFMEADTVDGAGGFIRPLSLFEEEAAALGHANVLPDNDGVVRRLPLYIDDGYNAEPALALTAIAEYLRRSSDIEALPENNSLLLAGRSIPLDSSAGMIINYIAGATGSGDTTNFAIVPFVDAMNGEIDPALFQDKIVLVGATAIGIGDIYWTPTGAEMNGVEIHANVIHTIKTADFLRLQPIWVNTAIILILALLCGLAVLRLRIRWAVVSTCFIGAAYFLIAFTCFDRGIMLNMVYPPLSIVGSFVGVSLYNFALERSEKGRITQTFGRYISTPVADNILAALENDELRLGGELSEVTVVFADIRGFTSMSEIIQPEELVRVLNIYLSNIIDAILKYDGMINKFGGDSIMAVWNAPTRCPEHALMAIKAALDAQHAIRVLQQEDAGLQRMDFGIGINTGQAIAGNLGSENRSEYSVIGDSVNVAARLTGAAEGGKVWIGSSTYKLVQPYVRARALEPFEVKGKRELIQAYEVMEITEEPQETAGALIMQGGNPKEFYVH